MNKNKILASLLPLIGMMFFPACSDNNTETGEPFLKFDTPSTSISVNVDGMTQANRKQVTVRSNRAWKVLYNNPADTTWLHLFINEGVDDGIIHYWVDKNTAFSTREGKFNFVAKDGSTLNSLSFIQEANRTGDRTVTLTAKGTGEQSNLVSTATITQSAPGLVMNEDFTWLSEGEDKPYYEYPEERLSSWSAAEIGHGWTSLNGFLYGGIGYIKLGKTKMAGDAVSPALTGLTGPTNIQVDFKGVGYTAGNNKHDDAVLKVGIMGPGELVNDNSIKRCRTKQKPLLY